MKDRRTYYEKNKNYVKDKQKKYYEQNKGKIKSKMRRYQIENRIKCNKSINEDNEDCFLQLDEFSVILSGGIVIQAF